MIGLRYVGEKEEGIRVMLFKSYKSPLVRKGMPYRFTTKDEVSLAAKNYYNKFRPLKVEVIMTEDEMLEAIGRKVRNSRPEVRVESPAAETNTFEELAQMRLAQERGEMAKDEDTSDSTSNEANENQDVNQTGPVSTPEQGDEADGDGQGEGEGTADTSEFEDGKPNFAEMSIPELGQYLDLRYDPAGIKDLIRELQVEVKIGNRGKGTLIDELVNNHFQKVVEHLSK